jgi:hypothetical protein
MIRCFVPALLLLGINCYSQMQTKVAEYNLLCGARPTLTYNNATIASKAKAEDFFAGIIKSPIQFGYPNGNCHNRAHLISKMAISRGITPLKIWVFPPGKYSLVDTSLIVFEDKNFISKDNKIKWGFHVAPLLLVGVDTMAIDPILSPKGLIGYKEWLSKLNIPNALYMILDWDWYSFNTLNGLNVYNNPTNQPSDCSGTLNLSIPGWFPGIITGDFFKYDSTKFWMEMGLAIDETAYKFYQAEILPLLNNTIEAKNTFDDPNNTLLQDYKTLVGNINNFETVFRDNKTNNTINEAFISKHEGAIKKYRAIYEDALERWKKFVAVLDQ